MNPSPDLAMPVWRVLLAVRPQPCHPLYWAVQAGALAVWLVAKDRDEAFARARQIVAATTLYEIKPDSGETVASLEEMDAHSRKLPNVMVEGLHCTPIVLTSGLALFFHSLPTGEDEAEFFDLTERSAA